MATIKSHTDLSQSKTLSKILRHETADMAYIASATDDDGETLYTAEYKSEIIIHEADDYINCWSLAALLDVLPNNEHITTTLSRGGWKIEPVEYIDKWFCEYEDEVDKDSPCREFTVSADNQVDACVAMIEKLHELKML